MSSALIPLRRPARHPLVLALVASGTALALLQAGGCGPPPPDPVPGDYRNTTDPTNGGATYVGSAACSACHPDYADRSRLHGHAQALKTVQGAAPGFPAGPGVPNPPPGTEWNAVSYLVGGYLHGANYINFAGTWMTSQWNLEFPPNGTPAGFVASPVSGSVPFDCFRCHVTGAQPQSPENPESQGGRPGIQGTWVEDGVRCETCHGPGSRHVPDPAARSLYVDLGSASCAVCHQDGEDPAVIPTANGFISMFAQVNELRASGGHARFNCGTCHDPHAGTVYDRASGIRNRCTVCHTDANLALHAGLTYRRGDYVEAITCESCHMPYTGFATSAAGPDVLGTVPGRIGDVRGHIFRLSTTSASVSDMIGPDGNVRTDSQGRASITLDFVCLRCHTGTGNAFAMMPEMAIGLAPDVHNAGTIGRQALLRWRGSPPE